MLVMNRLRAHARVIPRSGHLCPFGHPDDVVTSQYNTMASYEPGEDGEWSSVTPSRRHSARIVHDSGREPKP